MKRLNKEWEEVTDFFLKKTLIPLDNPYVARKFLLLNYRYYLPITCTLLRLKSFTLGSGVYDLFFDHYKLFIFRKHYLVAIYTLQFAIEKVSVQNVSIETKNLFVINFYTLNKSFVLYTDYRKQTILFRLPDIECQSI